MSLAVAIIFVVAACGGTADRPTQTAGASARVGTTSSVPSLPPATASPDPFRDQSSQSVSPWDVGAGECFDRVSVPSGEVIVGPCDDPHEFEIISVIMYPAAAGDPIPDADAFHEYVYPLCSAAYADYVGTQEVDSVYQSAVLDFGQAEWDAGERRVPCAAMSRDGQPITGSVKGIDR